MLRCVAAEKVREGRTLEKNHKKSALQLKKFQAPLADLNYSADNRLVGTADRADKAFSWLRFFRVAKCTDAAANSAFK